MLTLTPSIEGLWFVQFASNKRIYGAGTVTLESGQIFGGDSQYTFTGKYLLRFDNLEAEINVEHVSALPPQSVFGTPLSRFRLKLAGKFQTPVMELVGSREEDPNDQIAVVCTKRAELP